jgi:hypothetical protein
MGSYRSGILFIVVKSAVGVFWFCNAQCPANITRDEQQLAAFVVLHDSDVLAIKLVRAYLHVGVPTVAALRHGSILDFSRAKSDAKDPLQASSFRRPGLPDSSQTHGAGVSICPFHDFPWRGEGLPCFRLLSEVACATGSGCYFPKRCRATCDATTQCKENLT